MLKNAVLAIVCAVIMFSGFVGTVYAEPDSASHDISIFSKPPEIAREAGTAAQVLLTQADIDAFCEYFSVTYSNLRLVLWEQQQPDLAAKVKIIEDAGWDEERALYVIVVITHMYELDNDPGYLERVREGRSPHPYGEPLAADVALVRANQAKIQLAFDGFKDLLDQ